MICSSSTTYYFWGTLKCKTMTENSNLWLPRSKPTEILGTKKINKVQQKRIRILSKHLATY